MTLVTILIIYFLTCLLYRNNLIKHIFILRALQTLKINKYRNQISLEIKKNEKRFKWYIIWPVISLYEWYEDWQKNRNRNTKS